MDCDLPSDAGFDESQMGIKCCSGCYMWMCSKHIGDLNFFPSLFMYVSTIS